MQTVQDSSTLNDIKKYIEDGEMSFLIGAGFSRNVNKDAYPMWGGLLRDAIWNMFGSGKRTKHREDALLSKVEKEYGYLGFASMMVKKAGYHEAIDTYIESKTPYIKTVGEKPTLFLNGKLLHNHINPDCHVLLKNLDIQNIYTFNYDNALEFFMGEEARLALEEKIEKSEYEIEKTQNQLNDLNQQKSSLKERIDSLKLLSDSTLNFGDAVKNTDKEGLDIQKMEQELEDIQKTIFSQTIELNEQRSSLETHKKNLKTYYNVVKDSYEISLSAKRKSIYKIHGSLRKNTGEDYGFDGDKHIQYIITQEDYDTYNEKHSAFVNMMRIDLLRNRFCIMGVSGGDANFLAWINWVKDVLDKTKDRATKGKEKQHLSYFIYSGTEDMSDELALMLRNHFIEPIILKNVFPTSNSDEERIKLFLEYMQPFGNKDASRFSDLWGKVKILRNSTDDVKSLSDTEANELFRLSLFNRFSEPYSIAHYNATNVQFAYKYYLRDDISKSQKLIYAAALRSTLMPIDLSIDKEAQRQLNKEKDEQIETAYEDAFRRAVLLQHLPVNNKLLAKEDKYSGVLYDLYDFKFPTENDINTLPIDFGIGFVRKYSLLQLLHIDTANNDKYQPGIFNSPQEFVLAADWLDYLGYDDTDLYQKADEYKRQGKLISLYDYYKAYLSAMHREEEINTYGNVNDTVFIDKYTRDEINAAVLLNSFVELGICFAGHIVLDDIEWLEIVRALKRRYPIALIFYTIARGGKDRTIKLVAQEMMYDEKSRQVLPSVLKNIIISLVADSTPVYLKGKMAQFASEILPAVNQKKWCRLFVQNAETILDIADSFDGNLELSKSSYGFIAKALEYITAKELRLRLLKRVLENMNMDNQFGSYYNTLVISARERLKPADFVPLIDVLITFAQKSEEKKNQQANFILMNLLMLIRGDSKFRLLEIIENRSVRDPFLVGGYVYHIKNYPELINSFLDYYLKIDDLWNSGISKDGIRIGGVSVNVSQIDKLLGFNDIQVSIVYDNLRITLNEINKVLQKKKNKKANKGLMSPENSFQEILMDMRLFVNNHQKQLVVYDDYKDTYNNLIKTYNRCFFEKNVFELIADDEMYKAIRKMMTEVDLYGLDIFKSEYEQILGRIIAKDSKELNILLRHISWAMNHYKAFFNNSDFIKLFKTILTTYQPYFNTADGGSQTWNLIGCQKEVAEKALTSISKTLGDWGIKDDFWSTYKKVFH